MKLMVISGLDHPQDIENIKAHLLDSGITSDFTFKVGENTIIDKDVSPDKPDIPPEMSPGKYLERSWIGLLEKGSRILDKTSGSYLVYLKAQEHTYYFYDEAIQGIIQINEEDLQKKADDRQLMMESAPMDMSAYLDHFNGENRRRAANDYDSEVDRTRHMSRPL